VRSVFNKNNGSLGEPGSVAYLFEQKGYLLANGDEDTVMMAALEGGADDVNPSEDAWEILCAPVDLNAVRSALEEADLTIEQAEVTQMPSVSVALDETGAVKVLRLVDALEDLEDVQSVYGNFDIPDEVLATLG
jgi:transcriptional/translational regulatory protein YebC/TACO1